MFLEPKATGEKTVKVNSDGTINLDIPGIIRFSLNYRYRGLCLLKAARAYLENPENWLQGYGVRWANGRTEDVFSAVRALKHLYTDENPKTCLVGALFYNTADPHEVTRAVLWLEKAIYGVWTHESIPNVARWNDEPERTHTEILAILDEAIELAA